MSLSTGRRSASADLAPTTSSIEFQATPEQALGVLQVTSDRLVSGYGVVTNKAIGNSPVRHLRLPCGGRATLLVGRVADSDRGPQGAHVLTMAITDPGQLPQGETQRLLREVEAVPFTDFEVGDIRAQLPLTTALSAPLSSRPFRDLGLFLTIHHMSDFVPMVETLIELGASPDAMTVIDKEYSYALSRRVDSYLRDRLRLEVHRYSELDDAIIQHFKRTAQLGVDTLIMDDGGYVFPAISKRHHQYTERVVGLVEQTASGIWKLDGIELPIPVFSVAESTLKGAIESYGIADAAVRNTLALLPNHKFEGQSAVVLGYGRIGRQVAQVLRTRRMRVSVYDQDLARLVTAHEEGFLTALTAADLLSEQQPLVIFGTTGRGSVGTEHLDSLTRDCYLISTTSRDFEFRLDEFAARSSEVQRRGRLGTTYRLDTGVSVTALGHGFPINFHYAESLPNRYVDLVMGAMVLGAVTLADPDHGFQPGHNLTMTNHILENSALLRDYYRLYGPPQSHADASSAASL